MAIFHGKNPVARGPAPPLDLHLPPLDLHAEPLLYRGACPAFLHDDPPGQKEGTSMNAAADPAKGRRVKILRVSGELLRQMLLLPENARIVDLSHGAYFDTDEFALKVECDDFPPVAPGQQIPQARASYSNVTTTRFDGWQEG